VSVRIDAADGRHRERAVAAALAATRRGDLILLPTETSYALATDAFSARGRAALREAKDMDESVPLPVLVGRRSTVSGIATVSPSAQLIMDAFWPGPVTVLLEPQRTLAWDHPAGAPVAVRMPLHPLTLAVLAATGPLAVTAANLPGMRPPVDVDQAVTVLGDLVAIVLDAGTVLSPDAEPSTIVDCRGPAAVIARAGAVTWAELSRVLPEPGPEPEREPGPSSPDA
jgi:tRNA threonylcarbamoyl adenosine modification protein (Sua5/YciO/YrdC/YwlC family)